MPITQIGGSDVLENCGHLQLEHHTTNVSNRFESCNHELQILGVWEVDVKDESAVWVM